MRIASTRSSLFALLALVGCASAAPRPGFRSGGRPLAEDEVRADLGTAVHAMREAYAGRPLMTGASWELQMRELAAIPTDRHTADTLCAAIAEVLRQAPWVRALDGRGQWCILGGVVEPPAVGGENLAATSDASIVVREWQNPPITAIGVRRFDASASLPEGARSAIERAEAVIVDLRGATGDDPQAVRPLVEALLGDKGRSPLRAIHEQATPLAVQIRAAIPRERRRDRRAWEGLVGAEAETPEAPSWPTAKRILVLLGGACDAPCQLAARWLGRVPSGHAVGMPQISAGGLFLADFGEIELRHSAIRLRIPTTFYAPSPWLFPTGGWIDTGIGGNWGSVLSLPPLAGFDEHSDLLEQALAVSRTDIERRARAQRFEAEPPPPCASFPSFADVRQLPEPARRRLSGGVWPPPPRMLRVYFTMNAKSSQSYVAGCPGLVLRRVEDRPPLSVGYLDDAEFSAISRLLQSDAVELLSASTVVPSHTL